MKFARYTFLFAGIVGLLMIVPQFFLEENTGREYPPAINHPEYYYGFFSVALAWQVAFLIIAQDPRRCRPLMIGAMLEKFGFAISCFALFALGRVPAVMAGLGGFDFVLGLLFVAAFLKTKEESPA